MGYSKEDISKLNFADLLMEDQLPEAARNPKELPETGTQKELSESKLNRGVLYDAAVVDACCRLFNERDFKLDD